MYKYKKKRLQQAEREGYQAYKNTGGMGRPRELTPYAYKWDREGYLAWKEGWMRRAVEVADDFKQKEFDYGG